MRGSKVAYAISKGILAAILAVVMMSASLVVVLADGAGVMRIRKSEAECRIIGQDVESGRDIVSCFYGIKVDSSRIDISGNEITNEKTLAFEELWEGGTFVDGKYQEDGDFIGKYRKDFKYNDNADVFWKVEVGLNGSTLEYCSMRDQEYANTARTKEECNSLLIDIQ
jgi:hypothetical protein